MECTDSSARRFARLYGWGIRGVKRPGKFLDYDHRQVKAVRTYVRRKVEERRYHPRLVCNIDHVWTERFRNKPKQLWKPAWSAGRRKVGWHKNNSAKMRTKRLHERRNGVLTSRWCLPQVPCGASRGSIAEEDGGVKPGDGPRFDVVANQRVPRTRVSFSWIDGEKGPLAMTLAESDIKTRGLKENAEESLHLGGLLPFKSNLYIYIPAYAIAAELSRPPPKGKWARRAQQVQKKLFSSSNSRQF